MKKWLSELNRSFSKNEVQMAKKCMKKCSIFLAIKEMQIKTKIAFYLTLVSVATIKNTNNNKCWQRCEKKGSFIHCLWECKLIQPYGRFIKTKNTTVT
jgi:hypothetical protein